MFLASSCHGKNAPRSAVRSPRRRVPLRDSNDPGAYDSAIDIHDPDGACRHGDDISVAGHSLPVTEEAS